MVERLNRELAATLNLPDIQEAARSVGSTLTGGTPAQLRDFMEAGLVKYGKLVKAAGIKAESGN